MKAWLWAKGVVVAVLLAGVPGPLAPAAAPDTA